MTGQETNALHNRMNRLSETVGTLLVDGFHYLALFAIGGAIVWSAVHHAGQCVIGRSPCRVSRPPSPHEPASGSRPVCSGPLSPACCACAAFFAALLSVIVLLIAAV